MDRKLGRIFGFFSWFKKGGQLLIAGLRAVPVLSITAGFLVFVCLFYVAKANQPPVEAQDDQVQPKLVSVYTLGKETPSISVNGLIRKSGILQIKAVMGGVVQDVNVKPGDVVKKHANLIQLSTTYDGGNAAALQAEIARKQYQHQVDTLEIQKDLINKQRDVAEQTDVAADRLREINNIALGETRDVLSLNESLLEYLNDQIEDLEATASSAMVEELLFSTRQAKSQLQSGVNQLRMSVRQLELQDADDEPAARLSDLQREITLKQLEIHEKALVLGVSVAELQWRLAVVQSQMMHPTAFAAGVVERVFVSPGEMVSPGQTLLVLRTDEIQSEVVVEMTGQLAAQLSELHPSMVRVEGQTISVLPQYISSVATRGQLFSAVFVLPENLQELINDGEYVQVELSLADRGMGVYVPIDAVYQSRNSNYVYVLQNDKAVQQEVEWDFVVGGYVGVREGLSAGDVIILDRNVVEGDVVEVISSE